MAIIKGSDWGGSRLSLAQTCKQKYYNKYVRMHSEEAATPGIVRIEGSYAAIKGTLLHKCLQVYYQQLIDDPDGDKRVYGLTAIGAMLEEIPQFTVPENKASLLEDEIISAADQYFTRYAHDDLVPLAVEKPVQVYVRDPATGENHVHTGIIDLECEYHGGLFITDHKTTSQTFASLFQKYVHNLSFKGYCKALAGNGEKDNGTPIGVLINAIRFKNNKALEVEFEREPYMFNAQQLEEFDRTVVSIKREIEMCMNDGFWPKAGDQCVQPWGACEYFPLCKYDDPAMVRALYKPNDR